MLHNIFINVSDNLCQIKGIKGELHEKLQRDVFQADIYYSLDEKERKQEIAKLKAMGKVNHYYTGYIKFLKRYKFYNGFLPRVLDWFTEKGIIVTVQDFRKNIALFDTAFDKSLLVNAEGKYLRPEQIESIEACMNYIDLNQHNYEGAMATEYAGITYLYFPVGTLSCATNSGKTLIMMGLHKLKLSFLEKAEVEALGYTVMLVPTQNLFKQHIKDLQKYFGDDVGWVGNVKEGFKEAPIMVVKDKSFNNALQAGHGQALQVLERTNLLMVDEADKFLKGTRGELITQFNCSTRYAFTGSGDEFNLQSEEKIMLMRERFGAILYTQSKAHNVAQGYSLRTDVLWVSSDYTESESYPKATELPETRNPYIIERYENLYTNQNRNLFIARIAKLLSNNKLPVLIYLENLIYQWKDLEQAFIKVGVDFSQVRHINGKQSGRDNEKAMQDIREGKATILVGTNTVREGVNIPSLRALIFACGGVSPQRVNQVIGRIERTLTDDSQVDSALCIDFDDAGKYLSKHTEKRRAYYEHEQFTQEHTLNPIRYIKNYFKIN